MHGWVDFLWNQADNSPLLIVIKCLYLFCYTQQQGHGIRNQGGFRMHILQSV